MKAGVRAVGIAESFRADRSTLAGVVTRADRSVDGFAFGTCTVGGTDATESIVSLYRRLEREDIAYALVAGIALAWYNVLDLRRLHEAIDRPVCAVTFEESDGLESALAGQFSGEPLEERLATFREQPARRRLVIDGRALFYRPVGLADGEARDLLRAFTAEGGRPEPLRLARLAARAADEWRRTVTADRPSE